MQKIVFLSVSMLFLICTNTMETSFLLSPTNTNSTAEETYTICILAQNPTLAFTQKHNTPTSVQPYINLLTIKSSPLATNNVNTVLKNYAEISNCFEIVMQPSLTEKHNKLIWYVEYQEKCCKKLIKIKNKLATYLFSKLQTEAPKPFDETYGVIPQMMNGIIAMYHHTLFSPEELIEEPDMNTFYTPHIVIDSDMQNDPGQPIPKEFLSFVAKGLVLARINQAGCIENIVSYHPFKKLDVELSSLEKVTAIAKLLSFRF